MVVSSILALTQIIYLPTQMSIFPDYNNFEKTFRNAAAQLVWNVFPADLYTPVSVMLKLHDEKYISLFESVEGGENRGRYSFIVMDPDLIWQCDSNQAQILYQETGKIEQVAANGSEIFISLSNLLQKSELAIPSKLPPMSSGLFGYMGYDMVRYIEKLPDRHKDDIGIPEAMFIRPRIIIVFDSVKDEMFIISPVFSRDGDAQEIYQNSVGRINEIIKKLSDNKNNENLKSCENIDNIKVKKQIGDYSNTPRDEYYKMVTKAKEYILAGDIFQVVLSQRFTLDFPFNSCDLYRKLRSLNPSPFSFYMHMDSFTLVGSSPEILVRLRNGTVTVRPIAGTRPRGADISEDLSLEKDLLSDEKELAEHLMLVDLGRNDVGRVAEIGSVKVNEKIVIERYSHVMHIVSNVEGKIKEGSNGVDAIIAGFPVGTVSGAPKIRAMEIIDELEKTRRSFYAGGVGYLSSSGDVDMCIALRTGLVKDNKLYIQAGGGIVADSNPEGEYNESCNKAKALFMAAELVKGT